MKTQSIQDFKLKDIVLIGSLPDMGKVGGIVTQHLSKKLNTKLCAKIILLDKPWVNQKNGLIDLPNDEYEFFVDEKNSIVIFTGENQPQEPNAVLEMTELVISTVSKMGNIKMIISAGGYLPAQQQQEENQNVFGVATNSKSLEMLKSQNVLPLSSDVGSITWFNGLVLGKAKENDIDGIGLFGVINGSDTPQYHAASNIIKVLEKILGQTIDTSELDNKVIPIPMGTKSDNPGIG